MKNVVILNADNALNPSAKARIYNLYGNTETDTAIFVLRTDSKQTFDAQDWLVGDWKLVKERDHPCPQAK